MDAETHALLIARWRAVLPETPFPHDLTDPQAVAMRMAQLAGLPVTHVRLVDPLVVVPKPTLQNPPPAPRDAA